MKHRLTRPLLHNNSLLLLLLLVHVAVQTRFRVLQALLCVLRVPLALVSLITQQDTQQSHGLDVQVQADSFLLNCSFFMHLIICFSIIHLFLCIMYVFLVTLYTKVSLINIH